MPEQMMNLYTGQGKKKKKKKNWRLESGLVRKRVCCINAGLIVKCGGKSNK